MHHQFSYDKYSSSLPSTPHVLTPAQRYILHALVAQENRRGKALFALGYWVGCRVADILDLRVCHVHVGPRTRSGWLHLAGEGAQSRDIDPGNEARRLLYDYQQHRVHDQGSPYFFTSQRSPQLTADGLYHWCRALKRKAAPQDHQLLSFRCALTTSVLVVLTLDQRGDEEHNGAQCA